MKTLVLIFSLSVFAVNTAEAALFGRFVNVQQTQPKKLTEAQKIEQLIVFISKQEGTFIRNGSEYTPAQAAERLSHALAFSSSLQPGAQAFFRPLSQSQYRHP